MNSIAFIPARCGSKAIPFKNIKLFCGKPLIYWTLKALEKSNVHQVIVATDCEEIKSVVNSFSFSKVEVYNRKAENAQDTSSTESVMLEYLSEKNISSNTYFILTQLTTPFTTEVDFNTGLNLMETHDSVLSVVRSKRFFWSDSGKPINYDFQKRPRRQDFEGLFLENGAFYINSVANILRDENRLSGKIGFCEMPQYTAVEIDEESDWIIAESLMRKYGVQKDSTPSRNIKLFLTDVDGVLTDAGMYYSENGDELKKFCTYDGVALRLLQEKGVKVGMITTENRELNRRRAQKLKLDFDFHGVQNKLELVKDLCVSEKINLDEIAYIGDDVNCLELLTQVGIAACPANAMNKIKNIPNIIHLNKSGGEGVVREFIENHLM